MLRVVTLLDGQGDSIAAIELLERTSQRRQLAHRERLALARLEVRRGRIERVLAHCQDLAKVADVDALSFVAAVYASLGRVAEADATIAQLDTVEAPAAVRAVARAEYHAARGQHDKARQAFQSAVVAAPGDGHVWAQYLLYCVRAGDAAELVRTLDAAPGPESRIPAVDLLRRRRELVTAGVADPLLRGLVASIVADSRSEACVTAALERLSGLDEPARLEPGTLDAMQALADKNPRVLAVQLSSAELLFRGGRVDDALAMIDRASRLHPGEIQPLRLGAAASLRARRWPEALQFASRWRAHADVGDIACDVAASEALVELGRASEALSRLQPHLAGALLNPESSEGPILAHVHALVALGRIEEAVALLRPLCTTSSAWTERAVRIASRLAEPNSARLWLQALSAGGCAPDEAGRLALARAWGALWERARDPADRAMLGSLIEPMVAEANAPAFALFLAGTLAHESGDIQRAEALYRESIRADATLAAAHNNLAVLLSEGSRGASALECAEEALRLDPENPEYLDTSATIYMALGNAAKAAERFRSARRVDPRNPRWTVGLAEALRDAGLIQELRRMRPDIQALAANHARLEPALADRVHELHASVAW